MRKENLKSPSVRMRNFLILTILIYSAHLPISAPWADAADVSYHSIRVVIDEDYPPYIFKDAEGHLKGILPELWNLWEQRTGIHVEIDAMDWNEAQRRMQAGEFDVIDTIFRNENREKIYDFSEPYAKIEVPIIFRSNISGIKGIEDLEGFSVAVKSGDNAIDILLSHGITNLSRFNNYKEIVEAARDQKVNVFVVDKPPANYYLFKFGISNQFHATTPLYTGEFHRAVLKGNTQLLQIIQNGFAKISKDEYEGIERRWYGAPILSREESRYLRAGITIFAVVFIAVAFWVWMLKRMVVQRTEALQKEIQNRIEQDNLLRESEEKYRILLEESPDPIFSFTAEGQYRYANRAFEEVAGKPMLDIIGKSLWEVFPKAAADKQFASMSQVIHTGERKVIEAHIQRIEGDRYYITTISPIKDRTGKVVSVFCVSKDISDRKQVEDLLQESEKKFRLVFNNANDAIFILNRHGQILEVNPLACEQLGYTYSELISTPLDHIDTPQEAEQIHERMSCLMESGQIIFETVHLRKDGTQLPMEVSARKVQWGDQPAVISICRDISERNRIEEQLRESEKKFNLTFTLSPDSIIISRFDDGLIVDVNEGFTRITGYAAEEVRGKKSLEIGLWQNPVERHQMLEEVQRKGFFENFETQTRRKNGTVLTGLTSVRVFSLKGVKHLITIVRDITEHKIHQEEQLKIEKLESLGTLAGGIAHDFNNILTGIMGNISFAKVLLDTSHQSFKLLSDAEKATMRAGQLAHQLLTFSRGGKPIKKVVSLRYLVHEAVSLVLHGSNVKEIIDIPDSIHAFEADEGQISQVLNNIIINATQAMPEGGTLTITARNEFLSEGNTLSLSPGTYICLTLADQGCGIPYDNLLRIFDPYFTTKPSGNGLGLASAYSIVNRHGGHIDVSSEVGEGTTFTIHLPSIGKVYKEYQPYIQGQIPDRHTDGSILVMDDDETVRDIAAAMLTHLGYAITTCADGEQAVEFYKTSQESGNPFSIVILDLTIPGGLGGKQAAEQILSFCPKACLIVSSGYSNDPIMSNYREYGFSGAIAKPYDIHKFKEVLTEVAQTL
ncbi:MAG: PAS domain S-box protein [Desulfocapsaceae bacterium]|nr:PAS domain S-box protein [Desulfocapsaceae bacterium]